MVGPNRASPSEGRIVDTSRKEGVVARDSPRVDHLTVYSSKFGNSQGQEHGISEEGS